MNRKCVSRLIVLTIAVFPLAVAAESYRFDDRLADAKQVTVTPASNGVGSRPLFSLEGPLAWQLPENSAGSQLLVEAGCLVLITKSADCVCSPDLNLEMSGVGCLELELRVEGQDTVQITRRAQMDRQSCDIAVPKQGEFFTARIDPRAQNGWMLPPTNQFMIGVNGAARLEIRAVRAIPPLLVEPVGVGQQVVGYFTRQTLYAHCPMVLEYTLRVPQRGFFTAGLGVAGEAQPVAFRVDVRTGATTTPVVSRTVEAPDTWTDVEADLSAFAGQEVTVTLGASCSGPGQVALWSSPAVLEKRAPETRTQPNIVYYVVDALRPDHLDAYGYARKTAPEITAFAEKGVRFEWCLSQATWTMVSVASAHTGVESMVQKVGVSSGQNIPPSLVTFAEVLREAGYTTGAVSDNPLAPPKTAPRSAYDFINRAHQYTTERAASFLEANRDRPFLLYMHTLEAHSGPDAFDEAHTIYTAPPPFKGMFSSGSSPKLADYYDDTIGYASKNFDDVLKKLDELGLSENTVVVLAADHGEAFLDHGMITHAGAPYTELIRVPLMIVWPGVLPAGKVFNETVSLLDLAPTFLDCAGIPIPAQFQGLSLRRLVDGTGVDPFRERTVYSHGIGSQFDPATDKLVEHFVLGAIKRYSPKLFRSVDKAYFCSVFSAVKMPWALWHQHPDGPTRLYNLELDPGEMQDVAAQHPDIVKTMREQLDAHRVRQAELSTQLGTSGADKRNTFDKSQQEALEALGYLGR